MHKDSKGIRFTQFKFVGDTKYCHCITIRTSRRNHKRKLIEYIKRVRKGRAINNLNRCMDGRPALPLGAVTFK